MENYKNTRSIIKQVDACDCNGKYAVQVSGEISNNYEPLRPFVQSFVLTPQAEVNNKYYVLSDIFGYVDKIWSIEDTDKVVESESVGAETQEPATTEEVEPVVSQAKSSTVDEAEKVVDEPAKTVTDKKQVEREAEEASPNAEEQTAEKAAPVVKESPIAKNCPVVKESPVAKKSPVVEDPPKPVVKPATSTSTEVQKPQLKVAPAKKTWATFIPNKSKTSYSTKPVIKVLPKPMQAPKKQVVS